MKLSKIYTNKDEVFTPIHFNKGLNIIIGRMFNKTDMNIDTHNLGKTFLITVIDFLLLNDCNKNHTFKESFNLFKDFEFYLEIELNSGKYLTIKRTVGNDKKINIKIQKNEHVLLSVSRSS